MADSNVRTYGKPCERGATLFYMDRAGIRRSPSRSSRVFAYVRIKNTSRESSELASIDNPISQYNRSGLPGRT